MIPTKTCFGKHRFQESVGGVNGPEILLSQQMTMSIPLALALTLTPSLKP